MIARIDDREEIYPALGIASTLLGTVIAVSLIPYNVEPSGSLFWPAVAMTIGLVCAPFFAGLHNPGSILRAEHIVVLAPVYWLLLDLLQGAYDMSFVEQRQVQMAFVSIGVFVAAVWLSSFLPLSTVPRVLWPSTAQDFQAPTLFTLAALSFALAMLNYAIPCGFNLMLMFSYLGTDRWSAPWGRGQLGGWDSFRDHLQYFGYGLPSLTVMIGNQVGWLNWRSASAVLMSATMTAFVAQSGGRRLIGVMVLSALVVWWLSSGRSSVRKVFTALAVVCLLLLGLQAILETRNVGVREAVADKQAVLEQKQSHLHVDDNFLRLAQLIKFIPDQFPYVYEKYVIWILIRPIPRVFWPGKPLNPGFELPSLVGVEGASLSSSVIGELHLSGGLFAIALGGWLYGRLASMATSVVKSRPGNGRFFIYAILVLCLFAGMRSMLELILMSYTVVAWVVLVSVYHWFRGGEPNLQAALFPRRVGERVPSLDLDRNRLISGHRNSPHQRASILAAPAPTRTNVTRQPFARKPWRGGSFSP